MTNYRNTSGRHRQPHRPTHARGGRWTQHPSRHASLAAPRAATRVLTVSAGSLRNTLDRLVQRLEARENVRVVSPSVNLDELIDTRRLTILELQRLNEEVFARESVIREQVDEITGRDGFIHEQTRTIDIHRRRLIELAELLDDRQHTLTIERGSHYETRKALESQKEGHLRTKEALDQSRSEILTLTEQHQAILTDFQQRESSLLDRLKQAEAVITTTLPKLLEKAGRVDQTTGGSTSSGQND
nr:hypothetical protein CFP56_75119 [Quercus suber]